MKKGVFLMLGNAELHDFENVICFQRFYPVDEHDFGIQLASLKERV